MDDVVIIGGGIIGVASAYFYQKKEEKLRLLRKTQLTRMLPFHYLLVVLEDSFFKKRTFY